MSKLFICTNKQVGAQFPRKGDMTMDTPLEVLARMTPELIANELEYIAQQIREPQPPDLVKPLDEIDALHLRQIADWIDAQRENKS